MSQPCPHASVIIPTFNKSDYLELTLASWCQVHDPGYELIIADDGSTDRTREVVRAFAERLPLRYLYAANGGRSVARNRGIAAALGSCVIFCDDDRVVHPQFLQAHLAAHRECASPLVAIGWQHSLMFELRPDDPLPPEAVARALDGKPQLHAALLRGETVRTLTAAEFESDPGVVERLALPEPWFDGYVLPVLSRYGTDITDCTLAWSYGNTGNLSVNGELLARVGPFDETFCGWGLEDAELHYRLAKAGARTRVLAAARNYHLNHARNDLSLRWNWLRNARTFLDKHEDMDIALYVQAELTNMPLAEADRILHEARAANGSVMQRAYRRLLINNARELATYGQMV